MKKIIYALILLASWPSFARQFDVEVIIFKRNVEPTSFQEAWPDILDPVNLERAFSYRDKKLMKQNRARLLPLSYYRLNSVYTKLQNHAGFKPLLHVAWRQGDSGRTRSPIFHIQAGEDFSNRFAMDGRTLKDAAANPIPLMPAVATESDALVDTPQPIIEEPSQLLELDGTLQVYVQHYLYVKTALDLKIPGQHEFIINSPISDNVTSGTVNAEGTTDSNVQFGHLESVTPEIEVKEFLKSYRMEERRQMRSGETHYIDHPLMGIIIQVRKA